MSEKNYKFGGLSRLYGTLKKIGSAVVFIFLLCGLFNIGKPDNSTYQVTGPREDKTEEKETTTQKPNQSQTQASTTASPGSDYTVFTESEFLQYFGAENYQKNMLHHRDQDIIVEHTVINQLVDQQYGAIGFFFSDYCYRIEYNKAIDDQLQGHFLRKMNVRIRLKYTSEPVIEIKEILNIEDIPVINLEEYLKNTNNYNKSPCIIIGNINWDLTGRYYLYYDDETDRSKQYDLVFSDTGMKLLEMNGQFMKVAIRHDSSESDSFAQLELMKY